MADERQVHACAQTPHTRGVNDNWNESVKVLRLEVDQDKARVLGVTQPVHCAGVPKPFSDRHAP
jgi:multidrug efflux pump